MRALVPRAHHNNIMSYHYIMLMKNCERKIHKTLYDMDVRFLSGTKPPGRYIRYTRHIDNNIQTGLLVITSWKASPRPWWSAPKCSCTGGSVSGRFSTWSAVFSACNLENPKAPGIKGPGDGKVYIYTKIYGLRALYIGTRAFSSQSRGESREGGATLRRANASEFSEERRRAGGLRPAMGIRL